MDRRGRAGTQALTLLALPLNFHVLRALAEESRPLIDLKRAAGSPPQTTMRGHMRTLTETGILTRIRRDAFPGSVDFELTDLGRKLLSVGTVLEAWLSTAPEGPIELDAPAAKSTVKALAEGWDTTIVRALAARPFSLTELSSLIPAISYPSLERRLAALRLAGLIEGVPSEGRGTPYTASDWLRRAVAPLASAARWEGLISSGVPAIGRLDIEAAFLLAVPLVDPPRGLSGSCRLAVAVPSPQGQRLVGVLVEVKDGRVVSCAADLRGAADGWASGSGAAWLQAVIQEDQRQLEVGGDTALAHSLIAGLHSALFRSGARNLP